MAHPIKARISGLLLAVAMFWSVPALAQMDFSGEWTPIMHEDQMERIPGPEMGEFFGIPINDAARARAEIWDASIQTLPEWQCRPHGADYITSGPSQLRIWKDVDPVTREIIAFNAEWLRSVMRPIYMDGRPHPSDYAAHTWAGFSTGEFIGNVLRITTTHLKEDYVRRNGLPRSDKATMTEYVIRNGDYLTWVTVVYDPVYLAEPFIRTREYGLRLNQQIPPYSCTVGVEVDRPKGVVPNHFPGENTMLREASERYGLPLEATMGGPETMYPEYILKLRGAANED